MAKNETLAPHIFTEHEQTLLHIASGRMPYGAMMTRNFINFDGLIVYLEELAENLRGVGEHERAMEVELHQYRSDIAAFRRVIRRATRASVFWREA